MKYLKPFCLLCCVAAVALWTGWAIAMPPSPELLDRIRRGDIPEPWVLAHGDELHARGIDAPEKTHTLSELLSPLDQNFNPGDSRGFQ